MRGILSTPRGGVNAYIFFLLFYVKQKRTKQNETATEQSKTKRNRAKQNETKKNKAKRNKTEQSKTKRKRTKQNETKRNKANRNETEQSKEKRNCKRTPTTFTTQLITTSKVQKECADPRAKISEQSVAPGGEITRNGYT